MCFRLQQEESTQDGACVGREGAAQLGAVIFDNLDFEDYYFLGENVFRMKGNFF